MPSHVISVNKALIADLPFITSLAAHDGNVRQSTAADSTS